MADTGPNPYASPASQPQPNVMNQYNASGVDVMNQSRIRPPSNMGRRPMAPTKPAAVGPGGVLAPEGGAQPSIATMQPSPTMGGLAGGRGNYIDNLVASAPGGQGQAVGRSLANPEPGQGANASGVRVGRIRPPRSMAPVRAYRQ